jgi:hypothetical protein
MKKLILLVLFFIPLYCYAQIPIDSFYVQGATWTIAYPWWSDENCSSFYLMGNEKIQYKIIRDTIISGINYHLLAVADAGGYTEPAVATAGCSSSRGFDWYINPIVYKVFARIRVDSNKVYFIQDSTFETFVGPVPLYFTLGQEYLLYNFNSVDSIGLYVSSIDSVTLSNSAKVAKYNDTLHGYWNYEDPFYPTLNVSESYYCIWGIGSSFGVLPDFYGTLTAYGPGAYLANGEEIALCYENPTFSYKFQSPTGVPDGYILNNCFDLATLSTPIYSTSNSHEIKLFPNPSISDITVTASDVISTVTISNLIGQVVYSNKCNANTIQIDVTKLANGIYFAKINGTSIKKFVKE